MSLNYTQLFTRIGKGMYLLNLTNGFRGGVYPDVVSPALPDRWELFVQQYDGESAPIRATVSDATQQLTSAVNALNSIPTWVSSALTKTVIEMLDEDTPLTAKTINAAIAQLIAEMKLANKTVNANTVLIDFDPGPDNEGDGTLITSVLDGYGRTLEYVYAESLPVAFTSSFTAGSERAQFLGEVRSTSLLSQDWPTGSGANVSLTSLDAGAASGNRLTNGDLETFTVSNQADDWTYDVGTAGTQFLSEASVVYKGDKALKIAGNGSTLSAMSQELTVSAFKAKQPYAVNFWAKMSAAPGAGVLTVDLYDGTSVTEDEQGNPNSFTVDLTTLGTTYVPVNGVFRLKDSLPDELHLRIRQTTALSNSRSLYLDQITLQPMTQLYQAGPFVALASGADDWSLDDTLTITVDNDYGGKLQTAFWRLFNMPSLGQILPSASDGSENVPDTFIA